ncbi:amidohydrolase [Marinilabiliaceae bacterium JC017]|nr:amidohydrolase [Marinilabiliaceae bacterium JC017]
MLNTNLSIAVFQQDIIWEKTIDNLKKIESYLKKIQQKVDLLILPEMFHAGFTMNPARVAEKPDGTVFQWMNYIAEHYHLSILGSVVVEEEGRYFNRLFVVHESGKWEKYDKRHLFRMGGENEKYYPGNQRLIFKFKGWSICPLICYDLRFPVWSRGHNDYDLLVYIANWPDSRSEVWKTLLKARALENQAYVIGVNRVGSDGSNGYAGDSLVYNARGECLLDFEKKKEAMKIVQLDLDSLVKFREKFPVWRDADVFDIKY